MNSENLLVITQSFSEAGAVAVAATSDPHWTQFLEDHLPSLVLHSVSSGVCCVCDFFFLARVSRGSWEVAALFP